MTIKYLQQQDNVIVGITLKEDTQPEANNMALHSCNNPEAILANRKLLANALQLPLEQFVCANQTHSNHFFKVEKQHIGFGALSADNAIIDTDGLYTFEKNVVLCSFTADCVPVLFFDELTGLSGAIHSGWQGTIKEITPRFMEHLRDVEQIDLARLQVWIGPALSQQRFEVDRDVYERFDALGYAAPYMYFKEDTNKYHIDNQQVVRAQLIQQGVPAEHITVDTTCTFDDSMGFSYRQNRTKNRHLSFITTK